MSAGPSMLITGLRSMKVEWPSRQNVLAFLNVYITFCRMDNKTGKVYSIPEHMPAFFANSELLIQDY
jgi:hypothetical protein